MSIVLRALLAVPVAGLVVVLGRVFARWRREDGTWAAAKRVPFELPALPMVGLLLVVLLIPGLPSTWLLVVLACAIVWFWGLRGVVALRERRSGRDLNQ